LNRQIAKVKTEGMSAAAELGNIWSSTDIDEVENNLQRLVYDLKSGVEIIDSNGRSLYSSDYFMGSSMGQGWGP